MTLTVALRLPFLLLIKKNVKFTKIKCNSCVYSDTRSPHSFLSLSLTQRKINSDINMYTHTDADTYKRVHTHRSKNIHARTRAHAHTHVITHTSTRAHTYTQVHSYMSAQVSRSPANNNKHFGRKALKSLSQPL